MKKLLLTTLLSIIFITTQINAKETIKTDEELIAEFMKLDKQIEQEKIKQNQALEKTKALEKLEKTVDKLANKLGVNK